MIWETIIVCFTLYHLIKPWVDEKVRRMEIENDKLEDSDE
jgi:hypothetical protein